MDPQKRDIRTKKMHKPEFTDRPLYKLPDTFRIREIATITI